MPTNGNAPKNPKLSFDWIRPKQEQKHFETPDETLNTVDKQTYLGLEMTSFGRYAYARDILSKKACKVLLTIKRSLANTDIEIKNKLFDALVKPVLLYGCEILGSELLSFHS